MSDELPLPVTIVVQHWPVLERMTGDDGKVLRGTSAYVRTKAPGQERTVVAVFVSPSRVEVYFGSGDHLRPFSIRTGRGVSMPDWIIEKSSLAELRNRGKKLFPAEAKAIERAFRSLCDVIIAEDDDDSTGLPPAAASPPANDISG